VAMAEIIQFPRNKHSKSVAKHGSRRKGPKESGMVETFPEHCGRVFI